MGYPLKRIKIHVMIQNPLQGKNPYSERYAKFKDSQQFKRLQNKFAVKPYYAENKHLKTLCFGFSYLLNAASIGIGFSFAYSVIYTPITGAILAACIAALVLSILEAFKRALLPRLCKNYLQFSALTPGLILCLLALIALSGFCSYKGGDYVIKQFTPPPHTIKIDSIKQHYSSIIASKEAKQNNLLKVKYKGTTTRTAQKAIEALQSEINAIRQQESSSIAAAAESNKSAIAVAAAGMEQNGFYFAVLALLFDGLLVLCLAYCEYYDYRSFADFAGDNNDIKRPITERNTAGVLPAETNVETLAASEKTVQSVVETEQQHCKRCGAGFEKKAGKKYCSDKCRIKSWNDRNKKNGKKLNLPI